MRPLSIYIHWPYCKSKCPYCDFNSGVAKEIDHKKMTEAYCREIDEYATRLSGRRVISVFFGGGTPSLMLPKSVEKIISRISSLWKLDDDAEITLEANPTSTESEKFRSFKTAGINRLSLGVQSLDDAGLGFLGRTHDAKEAMAAMEIAANTFSRFSFDLIYALHGQSPRDWETELERVAAFNARHLSLYQLSIEQGTPFYKRHAEGESLAATETIAAEMYEATARALKKYLLEQYEVSNYAVRGEESRHNLAYWNYDDYVGIGPGAHGRFLLPGCETKTASENPRSVGKWMEAVERSGVGAEIYETLLVDEERNEALLMGLRLVKGISLEEWQGKFGAPITDFISDEKIESLRQKGFLIMDETSLRTTPGGMQRLNAVLGLLLK